jgi:hypothetical protein
MKKLPEKKNVHRLRFPRLFVHKFLFGKLKLYSLKRIQRKKEKDLGAINFRFSKHQDIDHHVKEEKYIFFRVNYNDSIMRFYKISNNLKVKNITEPSFYIQNVRIIKIYQGGYFGYQKIIM